MASNDTNRSGTREQQKEQNQTNDPNLPTPGKTGSRQERGNNQDKESEQRPDIDNGPGKTDALNEQVNKTTESDETPKMKAEPVEDESNLDEHPGSKAGNESPDKSGE